MNPAEAVICFPNDVEATTEKQSITGTMVIKAIDNTRRTRDMEFINRMIVKAQEARRGQTMTEYALILSAVAVVVFVGYQTMGNTITGLLTTIDGKL
jgi:Flp pilus assembly pilin Flp